MNANFKRRIRRLNIATHRDLGYFFSGLIIIYCISGIALNHVNEWNPDFIIEKKELLVSVTNIKELTPGVISKFGTFVGEASYKVYDVPSPGRVKIYYDNASLSIDLTTGQSTYEKISRRPVFYHTNVLHRNSLKGWKWVSDFFGTMLITITITGLFILKGTKGITGRGKWFIAAGLLLPLIGIVVFELT